MKVGICGTMESNDCLITVVEHEKRKIEIVSIVDDFFHDQIEKTINDVLNELQKEKIYVKINDRGALDYTIRARLKTAILRMEESDA